MIGLLNVDDEIENMSCRDEKKEIGTLEMKGNCRRLRLDGSHLFNLILYFMFVTQGNN